MVNCTKEYTEGWSRSPKSSLSFDAMQNLFLFFLLSVVFVSCESTKTAEIDETTSKSLIDERFQECYFDDDVALKKCDSVLTDFFGEKNFASIQLNKTESFIACQEGDSLSKLQFGDKSCCVPRTFDLIYEIHDQNEIVFQFSMESGDDMHFDFISPQVKKQLDGYKLLLDGKITVGYKALRKMVIENGLAPKECTIELVQDTLLSSEGLSSYFWEVDNGLENGRWLLMVFNAMTGKNVPEKYQRIVD